MYRGSSTSSFENISATQLLGLDDEDDNTIDDTNGAYLSYLLLRHLKIRELRRSVKAIMRILCIKIYKNSLDMYSDISSSHNAQVLSDLNYFRSIERTLTIDDNGGLALSSDSQQSVYG